MSTPSNWEREELLTYWKKVKETIHLFDNIIVLHTAQWSSLVMAMIGASAITFASSNLVAGILALAALTAALLGLWKVRFYYELLEEALKVGEDVEKLIFKSEEVRNKFGLTHRLTKTSTKPFFGIIFFGWSIFLPFIVLAALSSILALFYFQVILTLDTILWFGAITTIIVFILFMRAQT